MRTPNEIRIDEITARQNKRSLIIGRLIGLIIFLTAFAMVISTLI